MQRSAPKIAMASRMIGPLALEFLWQAAQADPGNLRRDIVLRRDLFHCTRPSGEPFGAAIRRQAGVIDDDLNAREIAGAGQATKLVNQTLVLTNYCVIAEAVRLAQAYGVDVKKIPDALAPGHAGSNLLPIALPRMVDEDFAPRGYARQVLKDLEMLQAAAREHHLAMPMAAQALTLFRMLVASGKSELDGTAVVSLIPKSAP